MTHTETQTEYQKKTSQRHSGGRCSLVLRVLGALRSRTRDLEPWATAHTTVTKEVTVWIKLYQLILVITHFCNNCREVDKKDASVFYFKEKTTRCCQWRLPGIGSCVQKRRTVRNVTSLAVYRLKSCWEWTSGVIYRADNFRRVTRAGGNWRREGRECNVSMPWLLMEQL